MQIAALLRAILSSFGIGTEATEPGTLSEDIIGTETSASPKIGATAHTWQCAMGPFRIKDGFPCADHRDFLTATAAEAQVTVEQLTQLFYFEFFPVFADTLLSGKPHSVVQT